MKLGSMTVSSVTFLCSGITGSTFVVLDVVVDKTPDKASDNVPEVPSEGWEPAAVRNGIRTCVVTSPVGTTCSSVSTISGSNVQRPVRTIASMTSATQSARLRLVVFFFWRFFIGHDAPLGNHYIGYPRKNRSPYYDATRVQ
jgi:hypothetical protein